MKFIWSQAGPNPVWGCLLVEEQSPENNLLFVFRRRGLSSFSVSAKSRRKRQFCPLAHVAPPKNKKENGGIGGDFYNQVTPNGVTAPKAWAIIGCVAETDRKIRRTLT